MDERIQQVEAEAERIARELTEQTERLRGAIDQLRQDWATAQEAESLRAQVERLRTEGDLLRQSILRYAIACGTVDLKTAMLRRDPAPSPAMRADVQQAIEEEQAASEALRQLARQIQESERGR